MNGIPECTPNFVEKTARPLALLLTAPVQIILLRSVRQIPETVNLCQNYQTAIRETNVETNGSSAAKSRTIR
jgi:hypothetical protein